MFQEIRNRSIYEANTEYSGKNGLKEECYGNKTELQSNQMEGSEVKGSGCRNQQHGTIFKFPVTTHLFYPKKPCNDKSRVMMVIPLIKGIIGFQVVRGFEPTTHL